MNGKILNFRQGRHTVSHTHMLVQVGGVDSKEKAEKLVGKQVSWSSPAKKVISGKVAAAHGSKGAVRVIFEKGMPGQAIGSSVSIKD